MDQTDPTLSIVVVLGLGVEGCLFSWLVLSLSPPSVSENSKDMRRRFGAVGGGLELLSSSVPTGLDTCFLYLVD